MAQALVGADRLTPVLVGLVGYNVVAGFASLTNLAVAVWIMGLVYGVPVVVAGVVLAWVEARRAIARRVGVRRPLPG